MGSTPPTTPPQKPDLAAGIVSESPAKSGPGPLTLTVTIKDKYVLYATYMPFIQGGGLFIPTKRKFKLGDDVNLVLALLDEQEKISVAVKVVWITPLGAQGNRSPGIGVKFIEEKPNTRNKIETLLAGMLNSENPTHTM
jgi:type IV pilus assembly protein PilZ